MNIVNVRVCVRESVCVNVRVWMWMCMCAYVDVYVCVCDMFLSSPLCLSINM
jgi:hypothetical protein